MNFRERHCTGDATLYLADCLDIVSHLTSVDVLITDPPYGVDFKGKITKHSRASGGYIGGDSDIGPRAVRLALENCARGLVFCGTRLLFSYPEPYEIGFVYTPSGAGRGRWGFTVGNPVLFYGKATKHGIRSPNGFSSFALASDDRHPCSKPIEWMDWAVGKATLPGETVCDPFMGSGTTGVSAINAGRKFIGIEIEKAYFDIACERIDQAQRQQRLFA